MISESEAREIAKTFAYPSVQVKNLYLFSQAVDHPISWTREGLLAEIEREVGSGIFDTDAVNDLNSLREFISALSVDSSSDVRTVLNELLEMVNSNRQKLFTAHVQTNYSDSLNSWHYEEGKLEAYESVEKMILDKLAVEGE